MKNKLFHIVWITTLLLAMTVMVVAQDDETLQIAFIGNDSALEQARFDAAQLAINDLNTNDDEGILVDDITYQFELVFYEANTISDVVDAYEEAIDDDVIAILGPHDSELAEAITERTSANVPVFFGSPNAPSATAVYRLVAEYDAWGQAAGDYLLNERYMDNIAIVSVNTTTAQNGTNAFRDVVGTESVVIDLSIEADESDMSSEAHSIRDAEADVLFAWTLDSQMSNLLGELDAIAWDGLVMFAGLDSEFADNLAPEQAESLWGISNWSKNAYDALSQTFAQDYLALYGNEASATTVAYHDAILLLADAVAVAGEDVSGVISQLNNNEVVGVQGIYNNSGVDAVQIVQMVDGDLLEAARYQDSVCLNCADVWLVDNSDVDVTNSAIYTIGLVAPLDGTMDYLGEQIEDAIRLAIRDVNDAGGVIFNDTRYTFALRTYSATHTQDATVALNQAIDDGVDIVLGPDSNGQVLSNLFIAGDAAIPQLVSASNSQIGLGTASDYLFQLIPSDDAMASASATYLLDVRELENFATVAVRTDYGLDSAETFADVVDASEDGQVVLSLEHDIDADDMSNLATQIINSSVEVVAVWSPQPNFENLLIALDEGSWTGTVVYAYYTPEFAARISLPDGIELLGSVNWWSSDSDWLSQDFVQRYEQRYVETPLPETVAYYDAVYMIANALASGESDMQAWLAGDNSFVGVQGSYGSDAFNTGETIRDVRIIHLSTDGIETVSRYDDAVCLVYCD